MPDLLTLWGVKAPGASKQKRSAGQRRPKEAAQARGLSAPAQRQPSAHLQGLSAPPQSMASAPHLRWEETAHELHRNQLQAGSQHHAASVQAACSSAAAPAAPAAASGELLHVSTSECPEPGMQHDDDADVSAVCTGAFVRNAPVPSIMTASCAALSEEADAGPETRSHGHKKWRNAQAGVMLTTHGGKQLLPGADSTASDGFSTQGSSIPAIRQARRKVLPLSQHLS